MWRRVVSVFVLAAVSAAVTAQDEFVITDVTVIDGNGGAVVEGAAVIVAGGKITAIETDRLEALPDQALTIPGKGKYLLPGFIDSNVHASVYGNSTRRETVVKYGEKNAELILEFAQRQLRHGVTTVRDSYGALIPLTEVRDRIDTGAATGARMLVAGNIVGWGGPFSMTFSLMPESELTHFQAKWNDWIAQGVGEELMDMGPEEVRVALNAYLDKGPDFVKFGGTSHFRAPSLIGFSPRVQRVIVEETHKRGLVVETHATSPEALRIAVEAGIDLIQHPEILSRDYPDDLIRLIVDREVMCAIRSNTLTGTVWQDHLSSKDLELAELADEPEPQTSAERRLRAERLNADYELERRNAERLIRAGCRVTIATDNYQGRAPEFRKEPKPEYQEAGIGSILAIEGLVELGMTEMEAIMAATRNGAIAAGRLDSIGTIEVGKDADLLLLNANPLEDIRNIRSLERILAQGRLVDWEALPERPLFYTGQRLTRIRPDEPQTPRVESGSARTPANQEVREVAGFGAGIPIHSIQRTARGKLIIELESGEKWRQLNSDGTRVALPAEDSSLTADIKRSMFGSVSLTISGTGRAIRVSRVE